MRKACLVAAPVAVFIGALCVAGHAAALDASLTRELSLEMGDPLGTSTLVTIEAVTPLGADDQFCDYLVNLSSLYAPNDTTICVLRELRTPFAPSCILNERVDFVTIVEA